MKRYRITLLIATSLLVATPKAMDAQLSSASLRPIILPSTTTLSQTPPASSNSSATSSSSSAELIKLLGGSVLATVLAGIAIWEFFGVKIYEILEKMHERKIEKDSQKASKSFMDALKSLDKNPSLSEEFKKALRKSFDDKRFNEWYIGLFSDFERNPDLEQAFKSSLVGSLEKDGIFDSCLSNFLNNLKRDPNLEKAFKAGIKTAIGDDKIFDDFLTEFCNTLGLKSNQNLERAFKESIKKAVDDGKIFDEYLDKFFNNLYQEPNPNLRRAFEESIRLTIDNGKIFQEFLNRFFNNLDQDPNLDRAFKACLKCSMDMDPLIQGSISEITEKYLEKRIYSISQNQFQLANANSDMQTTLKLLQAELTDLKTQSKKCIGGN